MIVRAAILAIATARARVKVGMQVKIEERARKSTNRGRISEYP